MLRQFLCCNLPSETRDVSSACKDALSDAKVSFMEDRHSKQDPSSAAARSSPCCNNQEATSSQAAPTGLTLQSIATGAASGSVAAPAQPILLPAAQPLTEHISHLTGTASLPTRLRQKEGRALRPRKGADGVGNEAGAGSGSDSGGSCSVALRSLSQLIESSDHRPDLVACPLEAPSADADPLQAPPAPPPPAPPDASQPAQGTPPAPPQWPQNLGLPLPLQPQPGGGAAAESQRPPTPATPAASGRLPSLPGHAAGPYAHAGPTGALPPQPLPLPLPASPGAASSTRSEPLVAGACDSPDVTSPGLAPAPAHAASGPGPGAQPHAAAAATPATPGPALPSVVAGTAAARGSDGDCGSPELTVVPIFGGAAAPAAAPATLAAAKAAQTAQQPPAPSPQAATSSAAKPFQQLLSLYQRQHLADGRAVRLAACDEAAPGAEADPRVDPEKAGNRAGDAGGDSGVSGLVMAMQITRGLSKQLSGRGGGGEHSSIASGVASVRGGACGQTSDTGFTEEGSGTIGYGDGDGTIGAGGGDTRGGSEGPMRRPGGVQQTRAGALFGNWWKASKAREGAGRAAGAGGARTAAAAAAPAISSSNCTASTEGVADAAVPLGPSEPMLVRRSRPQLAPSVAASGAASAPEGVKAAAGAASSAATLPPASAQPAEAAPLYGKPRLSLQVTNGHSAQAALQQLLRPGSFSGLDPGGLGGPMGHMGPGAAHGVQQLATLDLSSMSREITALRWIGQGGGGAVFLGVWQSAPVAVKFMLAETPAHAGLAAFEGVLSSSVGHPNVVHTYCFEVTRLTEASFAESPRAASATWQHQQLGTAGALGKRSVGGDAHHGTRDLLETFLNSHAHMGGHGRSSEQPHPHLQPPSPSAWPSLPSELPGTSPSASPSPRPSAAAAATRPAAEGAAASDGGGAGSSYGGSTPHSRLGHSTSSRHGLTAQADAAEEAVEVTAWAEVQAADEAWAGGAGGGVAAPLRGPGSLRASQQPQHGQPQPQQQPAHWQQPQGPSAGERGAAAHAAAALAAAAAAGQGAVAAVGGPEPPAAPAMGRLGSVSAMAAGGGLDSFHSDEGFGDPEALLGGGRAGGWTVRQVLSYMRARPGMYLTHIIMEHCDRGSLLAAIKRGVFRTDPPEPPPPPQQQQQQGQGHAAGAAPVGGAGAGAAEAAAAAGPAAADRVLGLRQALLAAAVAGPAPQAQAQPQQHHQRLAQQQQEAAAAAGGAAAGVGRFSRRIVLRAVLRTARDVAQGMCHLHAAGIIHGDLKPANVLLRGCRSDRRGFVAMVADFGLAKVTRSDVPLEAHHWSTVTVMAPEAILGRWFKASDVFSFGVLLWQLASGEAVPYAGLTVPQILLGVSQGTLKPAWPPSTHPSLSRLGRACTATCPEHRPSFEAIVKVLTKIEKQVREELRLQREAERQAAAAAQWQAAQERQAALRAQQQSALFQQERLAQQALQLQHERQQQAAAPQRQAAATQQQWQAAATPQRQAAAAQQQWQAAATPQWQATAQQQWQAAAAQQAAAAVWRQQPHPQPQQHG